MNIWIAILSLVRQDAKAEESTLQKIDREVTAVVEKVRPSVVQVTALFAKGSPDPITTLTFSGVVYSREGHIVTDATGLESATEIRVASGTKTQKAALVGSDRRTGVAVIKIDVAGLAPAARAENPIKPGAMAILVGNPFGAPGGAATGTVSGLARTIQFADRRYDNMIQLNLPVSPGDCGGFVADSSGRLVGLVHSVYAADTSNDDGRYLLLFGKSPNDVAPVPGRSVGFATPVQWVAFSADRIIKHGKMVRGWLGLSLRPLDGAARTQLGLDEGVGAEILRVERDGPARTAKIAVHDILIELDGKPVKDLEALQWRVAQVEEPTTVTVVYLRNRERHEAGLRIEIDPQP